MMVAEGRRQIVDEADNIIGFKVSAEVDHPQDIYRVAALWVTDRGGKVLVAQRAWRLRNSGGLWGPAVAGTVDEGETYESNIYKEAQEEIGLKAVAFTSAKKVFASGSRRFFCQWFTAVVEGNYVFAPDPHEVAAVRWVDAATLRAEVTAAPDNFIPHFAETLDLFQL